MTNLSPRLLLGLVAVLPLPVRLAAAEPPAPVVVTTVTGERFIGTPGSSDATYLHLTSQTLGDIRIPRAAIRAQEPQGAVAAAAPAPVAAPAPAAPPPPAPGFIQRHLGLPGTFDASIGLGVMAQSGILEQATWTGSLALGWKLDSFSMQSSFEAHRQTTHGVVIDDGMRWDLQLNRDLSPKRFIMAASFYREDSVMAIDREEVVFAGAGFNLVKTPTAELVTVIGPAYIWQDYLPPGPALPPPLSLGDPAGVLYQSIGYTLAPRLRLNTSALYAQSLEDQGRQMARLILSLDVALSDKVILSNSYFWLIDSLPRNGTTKYQGTLSTQLKFKL